MADKSALLKFAVSEVASATEVLNETTSRNRFNRCKYRIFWIYVSPIKHHEVLQLSEARPRPPDDLFSHPAHDRGKPIPHRKVPQTGASEKYIQKNPVFAPVESVREVVSFSTFVADATSDTATSAKQILSAIPINTAFHHGRSVRILRRDRQASPRPTPPGKKF